MSSSPQSAKLADRAALAVSGPEARTFLQGLITNDIARLDANGPLYSALLTPQGKILFDFLMFADGDAVLLDCQAASRDSLQKRLSLYRLRAKVEIVPRDDLSVFASWDPQSALPGDAPADPRLTALGKRMMLRSADAARPADDAAYLAHRLDLGVPEGSDFGQDKIFALDGGLDELNGVAFDKGCYVGQELTARMKHRGTARKRLLPVASVDGRMLPCPDTGVTANGHDIGTLTSTYGARGFALIRLDRLEDAKDATIKAGDVDAIVTKPAWLFA
jgi:tRNA-modifying protein YgfZ